MSDEALEAQVQSILLRIVPEMEGEEIDPDVTFRDQCDIDSLDYLNFVLALEAAFGVKIPETAYLQLGSLNSAVAYLTSLLETREA